MSEELEDSMRKTIVKSKYHDAFLELGEVAYDSFLNEGVLKQIPILKQLLAIGQLYGNVRDYLLVKKLKLFFDEFSSLSESEREGLIDKLDTDSNYKLKIGEMVIQALSSFDDSEKSVFMAKAFKLYSAGQLTYEELLRVNHALGRFLLFDLDNLKVFCSSSETALTENIPAHANFINAGLAYVASGYGVGGVHPNDTAHAFLRVANS